MKSSNVCFSTKPSIIHADIAFRIIFTPNNHLLTTKTPLSVNHRKYHKLQHYSPYAYHNCHLKPSLLLNLCSPFQYFLPSTSHEYFSTMTSAQRIPHLHFTFHSINRSPTFNVFKIHIPRTSSLSKLPQYLPLPITHCIYLPSLLR